MPDSDADGYYARIVVQKPPATPEWAGVLDRLTRAAAAFDQSGSTFDLRLTSQATSVA